MMEECCGLDLTLFVNVGAKVVGLNNELLNELIMS